MIGTCEICKLETNIVKHHIDYINEKTVNICRKCHQKLHRKGIDGFENFKNINRREKDGFMVDVNDKEYEAAKQIVMKDRVKYPSMRHYINMAIREKNQKEAHNEITNNNKGMA